MNKLVSHISSEMPIPLNWMIFALGMKISKTKLPKHTGCFKDQPYNIWRPDINLSVCKNKDFFWTFLRKSLKLSTFPVPKDLCSNERTFPGNKDPVGTLHTALYNRCPFFIIDLHLSVAFCLFGAEQLPNLFFCHAYIRPTKYLHDLLPIRCLNYETFIFY